MKVHIVCCNEGPQAVVIDDFPRACEVMNELRIENETRMLKQNKGKKDSLHEHFVQLHRWHVKTMEATQ